MRLLHTADWHLGKTLARRNRDAEHAHALSCLLEVVEAEQPDALLVAGDIFDSASPPPEAERQLYAFLTDLARLGVPAVMIAGNHDNPRRLAALRPLLRLAGVHLVDRPGGPDAASVELTSRDGRERLVVGCLPWLSERLVAPELDADIRAELAELADRIRQSGDGRRKRRRKAVAADGAAPDPLFDPDSPRPLVYADRARALMAMLARRFTPDTVNVLLGHLFMDGARPGGGERDADLDDRYRLATRDLPEHTHYVALGHIHRPQLVDAGRRDVPVRYAGSLLQLAFSEAAQHKSVVLLEATAASGVTGLREIPIVAGRALTDVTGTRDELRQRAATGEFGDDFLRVTLRGEPGRPGLADEIREFLPDAVQVRLDGTAAARPLQVVGTPRAECDLLDLYESYHRDVVGNALPPHTAEAMRHILQAERQGDPVDAVARLDAVAAAVPVDAADDASDEAGDETGDHGSHSLFRGLDSVSA